VIKKGGWRPSPPFFILFLISLLVLALGIYLHFTSLQRKEPQYMLSVSSASGKQSITFPVLMGDFFTLKYIHSVDKLPVYDDFQVSGPGEFMLLQTRQHTFGAGLGDWQGEVKMEDGLQVIKNINKKFTELHLRVGRVADHTFFVGDHEIPLSQTFLGGELVVVRIVKE
jgi:hypothetical protein